MVTEEEKKSVLQNVEDRMENLESWPEILKHCIYAVFDQCPTLICEQLESVLRQEAKANTVKTAHLNEIATKELLIDWAVERMKSGVNNA